MQTIVILVLCLHLLTAIFWAGTTFTLVRTGGVGAERLFRPQMIAATIALLAGIYLWTAFRPSGAAGTLLGIGTLCAIAAAGVQGALGARAIRAVQSQELSEAEGRGRIVLAQQIAAALLVVTIICMVVARYV